MTRFRSSWRQALTAACVLGGLVLQPTAHAQEDKPTPEKPAITTSSEIPDRKYLLGKGDTIEITVERYPDLGRTVTLFEDGTIDHPTVGTLQAAGMTTAELTGRLTEAFKKELKRPVVHVALRSKYVPPKVEVKVEIPKVTALGAVSRQGALDLPKPKYLRYVLAEIQPRPEADLKSIRIRYPDGTPFIADFSMFSKEGKSKDDILIKGGEEIILVEREATLRVDPIKFKVLGEGINKPGEITADPGLSILEALDKAGGFKQSADLEVVEVFGPNHKETKQVNVEKYMFGDLSSNYVIQKDDVIRVPLKKLQVTVLGEVGRPGPMNIRETESLLTVYLAAGKAGNGDPGKAQLIRRGKNGKAEFTDVNIRDIERQKKPDIPMMAGDVLFIPNKKIRKGLIYYLSAIASPLWLMRSIAPLP